MTSSADGEPSRATPTAPSEPAGTAKPAGSLRPPLTSNPRVADVAARVLASHGITHAFGMPGGEVVTLLDGLGKAGITFVLARQETAAAIMAAGAYAATGAPGLLITTVGPGLANAVNGIADAAQERVPLLVISGCVDHAVRGSYTHQVFDQAALLRPLVKASFEIEAEGAASTVARAIRLACTDPMGPVHLDLAPGTAAQPARAPKDQSVGHPAHRITPAVGCDERLRVVQDRLADAKRPLVIAGLEAVRSSAGAVLVALTERLGAPILTTYKAKGLVSEYLPQALGGVGLSPLADAELLKLAAKADLVLLVGYDPIEMRTGWLDPFGSPSRTTVIELSAHPADHGMHRADIQLIGDVAGIVTALLEGLPPTSTWPDHEPTVIRDRLRAIFAPPAGWGPHTVFDSLEAALPATATVTVDSGAHRILLSSRMRFSRPGALLQSAGLCTMGAAIPLAIGFASARPASRHPAPVVAVLGDGGLEMCLGELGTLRDQILPVIVVVLQDRSLALIELKQAQAGLTQAGVRMGATRYEAIAEAFSGTGVRVSNRKALDEALVAALARPTFTLIVCDIDVSDYAGRI